MYVAVLSTIPCFEVMVHVQNRFSLRHCYLSSNEGLITNAFEADMLFSWDLSRLSRRACNKGLTRSAVRDTTLRITGREGCLCVA